MATSTPKPKKVNRLGLTLTDYRGRPSTLCSGCGHDAVSSQIMKAFYEMGINPRQVAKMSGIGCSSKTPAYFLGASHGFNGVHGRMPSLISHGQMGDLICLEVKDEQGKIRKVLLYDGLPIDARSPI